MTKFTLRLTGEDSSRVFETNNENDTLDGLAKHLIDNGYLLGMMRTSDRLPEPEEAMILATQVKWITLGMTRQQR
jgi:hypothetical protein